MREKVDVEIDRLVKEGIVEPVQFSEWGTPIVIVLKKDNTVWICGDYRLTVNQACKLDKSMSMIRRSPKIIFQRYFFNTCFYIII